jgi:hypothetical protein
MEIQISTTLQNTAPGGQPAPWNVPITHCYIICHYVDQLPGNRDDTKHLYGGQIWDKEALVWSNSLIVSFQFQYTWI